MTTVLITGANRGIGLALVRHYLADGAEVVACCREPANATHLDELIKSSGSALRVVQLDVSDDSSIASLKSTLGDEPIDLVINNAGVVGPDGADQCATRIAAESWMNTLRINALAPVLVSQAMINNLKLGAGKKLVAISSDAGATSVDYYKGSPAVAHRYAYRASKAALNNQMVQLARDWAADGIAVLILNPGWVKTDMGGPRAAASSASISSDESALGIISRINELTLANSGSFLNYNGEPIAW